MKGHVRNTCALDARSSSQKTHPRSTVLNLLHITSLVGSMVKASLHKNSLLLWWIGAFQISLHMVYFVFDPCRPVSSLWQLLIENLAISICSPHDFVLTFHQRPSELCDFRYLSRMELRPLASPYSSPLYPHFWTLPASAHHPPGVPSSCLVTFLSSSGHHGSILGSIDYPSPIW